jgi:hypothetical protein
VHSILAVCFFKGTSPMPTKARDGVSTYLALTFGTLLSSQGTEAAFTAVSPAPPGFPFAVIPTLAEALGPELPPAIRGHGCPAQDFSRSGRGVVRLAEMARFSSSATGMSQSVTTVLIYLPPPRASNAAPPFS